MLNYWCYFSVRNAEVLINKGLQLLKKKISAPKKKIFAPKPVKKENFCAKNDLKKKISAPFKKMFDFLFLFYDNGKNLKNLDGKNLQMTKQRYFTDIYRNVVRPRSVIEGQLNLSANEQKLFDMILAQINRDNDIEENTVYRIYPEDYEHRVQTISNAKDFYRMLRTAGSGLRKKEIKLGDKRKGTVFWFVSSVSWNEDNGFLEVELSRTSKMLLLAMIKDEPDTFYRLQYSLQLSGKYTHAVYYMMKEFENTGTRIDFVKDLREKLKVPPSYTYFRFKNIVIMESVRQINQKTDIDVSFREVAGKTGAKGRRPVCRIDWEIKKKKNAAVTDAAEEAWMEVLFRHLDGRAEISRDEAAAIVRSARQNGLSQTQMKNRISAVLNNRNTKNFTGFCIWAMGSGFKTPVQIERMFRKFHERDHSEEWYGLLEKSLLRPERMTDSEKARFEELTGLEGR